MLLAVLAVAAAVGTWVESHYANLGSIETGQAAVFDLVYDAGWFNALLVLLFLNLLTNLGRRLRRGRRYAHLRSRHQWGRHQYVSSVRQ